MNKFANHIGYTDVNPFEVIRVVSEKTLEVRAMDAELDPTWKPEWLPGGFAGHCVNQSSQRWTISSNTDNPVKRIRKRKNGRWYDARGAEFRLGDAPRKFYDYNF